MTQQPAASDQASLSAAQQSSWRGSAARIVVVVGLAGVILWQSGVFTARPTVALVTSGDTPFWDRVIAGAEAAANVYEVNLKVIRSKTDVEAQTQALGLLRGERLAGSPSARSARPHKPRCWPIWPPRRRWSRWTRTAP